MILLLPLLSLLLLGGASAENITVQCNASVIEIKVKTSYLSSLVEFQVTTLSFKNFSGGFPSGCLATNDGTNVILSASNFSACASSFAITSDSVTYNYTAMLTTTPGAADIRRDPDYEFVFGCTYSTVYNVTSSNFVSVFKGDVTVGRNGTMNVASEVTLRDASGGVVGAGFRQGDQITAEVAITGGDSASGLLLKLKDCFTSNSSSSTVNTGRSDLIIGGCAQSGTTIATRTGAIVTFSFTAMQHQSLNLSQQFLYLHCNNDLCVSSDTACLAAPMCSSGRRRRSTSSGTSDVTTKFRLIYCNKDEMGCEYDCDVTVDGNDVCVCPKHHILGDDRKSCKSIPANLVAPPTPKTPLLTPKTPAPPANPPPTPSIVQHRRPSHQPLPRPLPRPHNRPIINVVLNYALYASIAILCMAILANLVINCRRHKGPKVADDEKQALIN